MEIAKQILDKISENVLMKETPWETAGGIQTESSEIFLE